MLELDLYFDRFIASGNFDKLSDRELDCYNEVLQMDDNDIFSLLQGGARLSDANLQSIIDQIRNTSYLKET
ncbi:MAG: gltA [Burkholderiales bacterium]|nr:gltA [Burkholderiales bacterium]